MVKGVHSSLQKNQYHSYRASPTMVERTVLPWASTYTKNWGGDQIRKLFVRETSFFLNLPNVKSPNFWFFKIFFICPAIYNTNQI